MWSIGLVVGPAVGGMLAEPASKFHWLDIALLRAYPYLLPCVVNSCIAMVGLVLVLLWLPETLRRPAASAAPAAVPAKRSKQARGFVELVSVHDDANSTEGEDSEPEAARAEQSQAQALVGARVQSPAAAAGSIVDGNWSDNEGRDGVEPARPRESPPVVVVVASEVEDAETGAIEVPHGCTAEVDSKAEPRQHLLQSLPQTPAPDTHTTRGAYQLVAVVPSSPARAGAASHEGNAQRSTAAHTDGRSTLCSVKPLIACSMYFLMSLVEVMFDELFPIWALACVLRARSASPRSDAHHAHRPLSAGGLAMDSTTIGTTLACIGVGLLAFQVYVYPKLDKRFGAATPH